MDTKIKTKFFKHFYTYLKQRNKKGVAKEINDVDHLIRNHKSSLSINSAKECVLDRGYMYFYNQSTTV